MAFVQNVKGFVKQAKRSLAETAASVKAAKLQSIRDDAQKAVDDGRVVFAYRIDEGSLNRSGSLGSVAEQIEVIEKVGWQLDQSTFTHDNEGSASAFLIFRRPATP
ncbi:hypothetical protein [Streptomyces sp. NPDC049040]|uniref:hypothetical protein n=1 Tax=Streptomyces sp. NPDC049040 TaxID=3365593 RepID=UPI003710539D